MLLRVTAISVVVVSTAVARGELTVSPRALDFGERGHGEKPQLGLTLTNRGQTPLRISEIRPSCSCITVRPARIDEPLAPGRSVKLSVTMSVGRVMGRLDKYVEIRTDQPGPARRVPVSMRVFAGLDMEPRQLQFAGECSGRAVTESVEIYPRRTGARRPPLRLEIERIVAASRRPEEAAKHFTYRVDDSARGKRIRVTLKPSHPEGRLAATLYARLDGRPFQVAITGEMFRGIKVLPRSFNFNRVDVDDPDTLVEESRLSAIDGRAFDVVSADFEALRAPAPGMELEVTPQRRGSGSEWILRARLRLPPGVPPSGTFFGKVRVKTDHPEKPELALNVLGFFP